VSRAIGPVLINGVPFDAEVASISVFDIGFQRGYGCFEAMRSYSGVPFRIDEHLARLARGAEVLRIELGSMDQLRDWCLAVASAGEGVLRVYVTGGLDAKHPGTDNSIVVFLEEVPDIPDTYALDIIEAPWHSDGRTSELTGAKTLSYGPNLAATMTARSRGFDDAALVGEGGIVLEGPTFSLGWVKDGAVFTPSLDRHILASVTRNAVLEVANGLGLEVTVGSFDVEDLLDADEAFSLSTVREVAPVVRVGDAEFRSGPVTASLLSGFRDLVVRETT
jgi:branched-subunit amino acid aminotransferase/4-amino-4-deoxychorismate lyase